LHKTKTLYWLGISILDDGVSLNHKASNHITLKEKKRNVT